MHSHSKLCHQYDTLAYNVLMATPLSLYSADKSQLTPQHVFMWTGDLQPHCPETHLELAVRAYSTISQLPWGACYRNASQNPSLDSHTTTAGYSWPHIVPKAAGCFD